MAVVLFVSFVIFLSASPFLPCTRLTVMRHARPKPTRLMRESVYLFRLAGIWVVFCSWLFVCVVRTRCPDILFFLPCSCAVVCFWFLSFNNLRPHNFHLSRTKNRDEHWGLLLITSGRKNRRQHMKYFLGFIFLISTYYPRTTLALPTSSNSDPGSYSGPSFPLPTSYGVCLLFSSREELNIFFLRRLASNCAYPRD